MSSKLYKKYLSLKIEDSSYFYLFKSGIFYIFISDDAKIISPLLNLKLTNLNSVIMKCGFPINSAEKYLKKMDELNLKVKVVTLNDNFLDCDFEKYLNAKELVVILGDFLNVNIDTLSISQAFDLLYDLQDKLKNFREINSNGLEKL